jgi:hypothetical protein
MKRISTGIAGLAAVCMLLNGCGNQADKSIFNSDKPEIKAAWLQALAADKANNYLSANTNLVSLLGQDINSAQMAAVQDTLRLLNERMNNAAAHGDANAQNALDALKAMQPLRGRRAAGGSR